MMPNWPQVRLGEVVHCLDSARKPVKSSDREPGPYPYYGASGVVDHVADYLFDGQYALVAEDGENLRSRNTPIAFLASGKFWVNNHAHILAGTDLTDVRFLAYRLESSDVSGLLTGSTQPKLTQHALLSMTFGWPPLSEQRAIADVLGALDDKIKANARLVPLLRELAKARLQAAALPEQTYRVGDVADVRKGLSYTGAGLAAVGMPMVNLANAQNFGWLKRSGFKHYTGPYKARHVAQAGALLISGVEQTWRNEIIGWPMLLPDDVGHALFSHHVFLVDFRPEHAWLRLPLWAHLYTFDARARLDGMVYGTTVATLPVEALTGLEFPALTPEDVVLKAADALLRRAWEAERESETLAALRDALLPPLISGALRVRDAEALVGEAV